MAEERLSGRVVTHRLAPGYQDWLVDEQSALLRVFGCAYGSSGNSACGGGRWTAGGGAHALGERGWRALMSPALLVEECEGIGKVNVTYYVPDSDLLAAPAATNRLRQARTMAAMMLFLLRRKLGLLPKREFHSLAKLGPVASKSS